MTAPAIAPLTTEQLQELETTLRQQQAELRDRLQRAGDDSAPVELDQSLVGRLSRMDAIAQQNMALSNKKSAEVRLRRINLALAAIDSGDYGYCRRCDEAIGFPRLTVQPEANLCLDCQDIADGQR